MLRLELLIKKPSLWWFLLVWHSFILLSQSISDHVIFSSIILTLFSEAMSEALDNMLTISSTSEE